ncbi:MAG: orotate phosphoribosyltransferase [Chloroflexus sp.]|jgi:orotate phosphoribosyltransferase|uniref:Orotate phosphoribosyltransferase n=1 Tax=Chloroflexus aurantiacus (strain ATCC 29366 / DSM 635 / J-10-fl) TaxID=324602 RepID=A9WDI4_CHLAA|nr:MULTISPECIES: phosphoribosyltransferase family protein [Chloroflexus]ABY37103.1 phosphoribosyltransferase [Chloroflexus aurantiacus J-10-fl]RMG50696.1 MAG: phosphoribosyltransferase [Chloroflexota bacterium]GIV87243.1 MAG: orotate phosphoribosyltransferase [Chloroflexus sp.]HBW66949.1 phosphoribosyltransferase [Chloroflexus aurantiacus]
MTEANLLTILQELGAIVTNDHIVYTSGRHGSSYVNKDALYPHTAAASMVGAALAGHFATAGVETVAGPTIGGVIMAQWTAHHLSQICGREVLAVYAEEEQHDTGKRRVFRRGYDAHIAGKRVLVVEDVITTGGSVRLVVEAVTAAGGVVVGVGALCNRGGISAADLGIPQLVALTELPLESYPAETCPLCAAGVPVNTRLGKGAAYVRNLTTNPSSPTS